MGKPLSVPLPLRHELAFSAPLNVPDGFGGVQTVWTSMFAVRAALKDLRTGEAVMMARLAGRRVMVARIRANASTRQITEAWRFVEVATGAVFNIKSVTPDRSSRLFLEVLCEGGQVVSASVPGSGGGSGSSGSGDSPGSP